MRASQSASTTSTPGRRAPGRGVRLGAGASAPRADLLTMAVSNQSSARLCGPEPAANGVRFGSESTGPGGVEGAVGDGTPDVVVGPEKPAATGVPRPTARESPANRPFSAATGGPEGPRA